MERVSRESYLLKSYDEVCRSYERIDDFRAKLLALLPGVSAALLVLLLGQEGVTDATSDKPHLIVAAGAFGAIVTIGLLCYEERGIHRCVRLVTVGQQLELDMGLHGRFRAWPHSLWRTVNEPFASGLVYSAVLAAWIYLALISWSPLAASIGAGFAFIAGVLATRKFYWWVTRSEERQRVNRMLSNLDAELFRAENREGDWEGFLRSTLADDFVLRRANKARPDEDADTMIAAIANDARKRRLLGGTVRVFEGEGLGVVTSVVELDDPPKPEDRFFQNVKVFRRIAGDDWRVLYWQVSGKPTP